MGKRCSVYTNFQATTLIPTSVLLPNRFFVVEDTILHTTQGLVPHKGEEEGLVTRGIVNEFWQMALSEVLAVLRNNCVREGEREEETHCGNIHCFYSSCRTLVVTTTCC